MIRRIFSTIYNNSFNIIIIILTFLIVTLESDSLNFNGMLQEFKDELLMESKRLDDLESKYINLKDNLNDEKIKYKKKIDSINKERFLLIFGAIVVIHIGVLFALIYLAWDVHLFPPEIKPEPFEGPHYTITKWLERDRESFYVLSYKPVKIQQWQKEVISPFVDKFEQKVEKEILPTLPKDAQIAFKMLQNNVNYHYEAKNANLPKYTGIDDELFYKSDFYAPTKIVEEKVDPDPKIIEKLFVVNKQFLEENKHLVSNEENYKILEQISCESDFLTSVNLFCKIYPKAKKPTYVDGDFDPRKSVEYLDGLTPQNDPYRAYQTYELLSTRPPKFSPPEYYTGIGVLAVGPGHIMINDFVFKILDDGRIQEIGDPDDIKSWIEDLKWYYGDY